MVRGQWRYGERILDLAVRASLHAHERAVVSRVLKGVFALIELKSEPLHRERHTVARIGVLLGRKGVAEGVALPGLRQLVMHDVAVGCDARKKL